MHAIKLEIRIPDLIDCKLHHGVSWYFVLQQETDTQERVATRDDMRQFTTAVTLQLNDNMLYHK